MSSPSIAIVIAAYNAQETVARAICSALAEPEVSEVVVVDDASPDATADRARACDDGSGRLKILVQPRNGGPSAARNRAIAEAGGEWIGILDGDDYFLPGRIKALLRHAGRADLIADDIFQRAQGAPDAARQPLLGLPEGTERRVGFAEFVESNVTRRGRPRKELGFIKPLINKGFLTGHGLRYREDLRLGEDYELYARALALGARLLLVPAQGYVSVLRPDSLSGKHTEEDLLHLRDCDTDLARIPGLSAEDKRALRAHYLDTDCRLQWRLLINAVKARSAQDALAAFMRPYPVPFYLLGQLAEQLAVRSARKLGIAA